MFRKAGERKTVKRWIRVLNSKVTSRTPREWSVACARWASRLSWTCRCGWSCVRLAVSLCTGSAGSIMNSISRRSAGRAVSVEWVLHLGENGETVGVQLHTESRGSDVQVVEHLDRFDRLPHRRHFHKPAHRLNYRGIPFFLGHKLFECHL